MLLSDKLSQFYDKKIESTKVNDSNYLKKLGISIKKIPNNLICEKNVYVDSTILPSADPIFLGGYTYMNDNGYIRGPVFIGRFCSIGRRISIGAGNHSTYGLSTHPLFSIGLVSNVYSEEEIHKLNFKSITPRPTKIGNDVWIGDGAVILPGVEIGTGAIIAANAVVTGYVPPYSVFGGVPAKLIHNRFPKEISDDLLRSNWWEYDIDILKSKNYKNIYKFLKEDFNGINYFDYESYSFG